VGAFFLRAFAAVNHPPSLGEKYYNLTRTAGTVHRKAVEACWILASPAVEKARSVPTPDKKAMPAADTLSVPVIRLFDQRDIEFLRAVPGYAAHRETEFRRRRCRIFRAYLRSVKAEFLAAQMEMETLRSESPEDCRQLALIILRCRMRLAWEMIPAYLCLYLYRWKLGSVALGPVVQRFEGLRCQIRRCIPGIS
jgi:hypothetical protein